MSDIIIELSQPEDLAFELTQPEPISLEISGGLAGPPGDSATVSVGSVTTGAAGSSAAVTNSGTANDAVLDFTIPRGDTGATGATGAAATVSVGSVTTGAAGSSAAVTNSGTANDAVLDFTIPRGDPGAGDLIGPASSTDNAIVRFDGTTGKVVQDSNVRVADNGAVNIGEASTGLGSDLLTIAANSGATSDFSYELATDTESNYSTYNFLRAKGTVAAKTAAGSSTQLGAITWQARTSAGAYKTAFSISAITTYVPSATNARGMLYIKTTNGKALEIENYEDTPVNYLGIYPNSAGFSPVLYATGAETNVDLRLGTKGSGVVRIENNNVYADAVGTTHTQTLTNKTLSTGSTIDTNVNVIEVLKKVYPIGSIYIATVSTNPATLFGFGTWAPYAEGRVIVGKEPVGTFGTAGATGGAKTHTLTISEMPAHTHDQNVTANPGTGSAARADFIGDAGGYSPYPQGASTGSTGGGGAHNNLQPYIVSYVWQRTA